MYAANIDKCCIHIIQQLYNDNIASIKLEQSGRSFKILKGVRQGDPPSPDLFNCVLQLVVQDLDWEDRFGITIQGKKLSMLRFPDDIVLLSNCAQELQSQIAELQRKSKNVGLNISFEKTKVITNSEKIPIQLDNINLE